MKMYEWKLRKFLPKIKWLIYKAFIGSTLQLESLDDSPFETDSTCLRNLFKTSTSTTFSEI